MERRQYLIRVLLFAIIAFVTMSQMQRSTPSRWTVGIVTPTRLTEDLLERVAINGTVVLTVVPDIESSSIPEDWVSSMSAAGLHNHLVVTCDEHYARVALLLPTPNVYAAQPCEKLLCLTGSTQYQSGETLKLRDAETLRILSMKYNVLATHSDTRLVRHPQHLLDANPDANIIACPSEASDRGDALHDTMHSRFVFFKANAATARQIRRHMEGNAGDFVGNVHKLTRAQCGDVRMAGVNRRDLGSGVLTLPATTGAASAAGKRPPPAAVPAVVHKPAAVPSKVTNAVALPAKGAERLSRKAEKKQPAAYYSPAGGFMSFDFEIPELGLGEGSSAAEGVVLKKIPTAPIKATEKLFWQGVVLKQLVQLKRAIALATALDRVLVLPPMVVPPTQAALALDPAELLKAEWLLDTKCIGKAVKLRPPGFLGSEHLPEAVKASIKTIRRKHGMTEETAPTLLAQYKDYKILHFVSAKQAWWGHHDTSLDTSLSKQLACGVKEVGEAGWGLARADLTFTPSVALAEQIERGSRVMGIVPLKRALTKNLLTKVAIDSTIFVHIVTIRAGFKGTDMYWFWHRAMHSVGATNYVTGILPTERDKITVWQDMFCHTSNTYEVEPWKLWKTESVAKNYQKYHARVRAYEMLRVMKFGFNAIEIDSDVMFLQNPHTIINKYPQADLIVSTDSVYPTQLAFDSDFEDPKITLPYDVNTGFVFFRANEACIDFVDNWVYAVENIANDPNKWEQRLFIELLRDGKWSKEMGGRFSLGKGAWQGRPGGPKDFREPGEIPGLYKAFGGKLLVGVISGALARNGYYILGHLDEVTKEKRPPLYAHTNIYSDKLHALREAMSIHDDPEYYDRPEGYLMFDVRIPELGIGEGSTINPAAVRAKLPVNINARATEFWYEMSERQLVQLRNALALAQSMNRVLILPSFFLPAFWRHFFHGCRGCVWPGPRPTRDIVKWASTVVDNVLMQSTIRDGKNPVDMREFSFMSNPRTPDSVKSSVVTLRPDGLDEVAAEKLAKAHKKDRVLYFPSVNTAWGGFTNQKTANQFRVWTEEIVSRGIYKRKPPFWNLDKTKTLTFWPTEKPKDLKKLLKDATFDLTKSTGNSAVI
eukprot:TRINITY_DN18022_c0_g1_i1.p1 TRINITY_DN18022_c0_g1~~TRINITY_DN18022_c0_g1_i1.p1  ORF type:complete len:1125 (+),score=413.64 TRINITY_DN18022_c0_g1_i1:58-3375(+)